MPSDDSDPSCDRSNINTIHIWNKRCIPQSDRQKLVQIKRNLAYGDSKNEKGWWEQGVEGMLCLSWSKVVDIKGGRYGELGISLSETRKTGCHIYHNKLFSATHLQKKTHWPSTCITCHKTPSAYHAASQLSIDCDHYTSGHQDWPP